MCGVSVCGVYVWYMYGVYVVWVCESCDVYMCAVAFIEQKKALDAGNWSYRQLLLCCCECWEPSSSLSVRPMCTLNY